MTLARVFVAVVFLILGQSFIASTGLLIHEFQGLDWRAMVVAHSHLFFFFPVFGILALAAFYLPSVIFTRPLLAPSALRQAALPGRPRRGRRALHRRRQIARQASRAPSGRFRPRALVADKGDPPAAARAAHPAGARRSSPRWRTCARGASPPRPLQVRAQLRGRPDARDARTRWRRSATASPPRPAQGHRPAARRKSVSPTRSLALQADPAQRSLVGDLRRGLPAAQDVLRPYRRAIGVLLASWRDRIDQLYRELVPPIERGVIIGASPCCSGPPWTTATSRPPTCCSGAGTADRSCA